ncbi:MAG: TaqI-like C-terminal specificity domain-containing protein [Bacteroidota bacterium]|nr:TaqI-like C-terminal specificity domain-containing protein [Bacteroidota bacterium]
MNKNDFNINQQINIGDASKLLEISTVTLRNWTKQGYLTAVKDTSNQFLLKDIKDLKKKIEDGALPLLRKRANKKKNNISFVPKEYLTDLSFADELEKLVVHFKSQNLDLELSIFVLTLKFLVLRKEAILKNSNEIFNLNLFLEFRRKSISDEINSWLEEIEEEKNRKKLYLQLFEILTNDSHDDTVGVIYQSFMNCGDKSNKGSYYTPTKIVDNIFQSFENKNEKFLDPCCGTGQFLIRAVKNGYKNPLLLYGFDVDKIAVRIARINIMLLFEKIEFVPNIYEANSLTDSSDLFKSSKIESENFQFIATNPPWGAVQNLDSLYPEIFSAESFSYFLSRSLKLLNKAGVLSFILPESILNIRTHSDIRKLILKHASIIRIHSLGRKFENVFTTVVRIDLLLKKASNDWLLEVVANGNKYKIPQLRFEKNAHNIFDIYLTEKENKIIEHVYSLPHTNLKNNSEWTLGIVTGNNKKYLSETCTKDMEPIIRGSDVKAYVLKNPSSYINFKPELFQQLANEKKYRVKEKLLYKFISKKLVFAYDNKQLLTLNSANILVPKVENYPIKLILALFNSKLYQFIFNKKFNTHKVLRGDLEKLPLPYFSKPQIELITNLADKAIEGKDVMNEIDNLIFKFCELNSASKKTIKFYDF